MQRAKTESEFSNFLNAPESEAGASPAGPFSHPQNSPTDPPHPINAARRQNTPHFDPSARRPGSGIRGRTIFRSVQASPFRPYASPSPKTAPVVNRKKRAPTPPQAVNRVLNQAWPDRNSNPWSRILDGKGKLPAL